MICNHIETFYRGGGWGWTGGVGGGKLSKKNSPHRRSICGGVGEMLGGFCSGWPIREPAKHPRKKKRAEGREPGRINTKNIRENG